MKLQREYFSVEKDGFFGAYFPNPQATGRSMIALLGDDIDDRMAVSGVKWLHSRNCSVMTMAPGKKDYGYHSFPLERFGKAIRVIQQRGNTKIGIVGASTTGMLALVAASFYRELSLTIAMTPCDFVMEGFLQDGKDGMKERPADGESTVTVGGAPLPYLPYADRHPQYWQKIQAEAKAGGDMIASRKLFEESERRHPVREEEKIRVENIQGKILFVGAEDDVLWDTCKYIRRMEQRLKTTPHESKYEVALYPHGTHFVFPEGMLRQMLPVGSGLLVQAAFRAGRRYPKECRAARLDIDARATRLLQAW